MHENEIQLTPAEVARLIGEQFPRWAGLPIEVVPSSGTDNALFRLGEDLAIRMPRVAWTAEKIEKEHRWLPELASRLPLQVPETLALGQPGSGFPWPWSVVRWLPGEEARIDRARSVEDLAADLAEWIVALHGLDASGGPEPGDHNSWRGAPLITRDETVQACLKDLEGEIDVPRARSLWQDCLGAPQWGGPPVWIHGDLKEGNLLLREGRLAAVLDFGCLGVGDPACDVMTAWLYLPREVRAEFRRALRVDEGTWMRACGWALSVGLIALPYYRDTNPDMVAMSKRVIRETLADFNLRA